MKTYSFLLSVLAFCLCCWTTNVSATHLAGADLTYESVGNNAYVFTFTLYRDCGHGSASASPDYDLNVQGCNMTASYVLPLVNGPNLITPLCPTSPGCGQEHPPFEVYEEYIYQDTVTLPCQCTSWLFWMSDQPLGTGLSARNGQDITTIVGSPQMYIEATLNTPNLLVNSSPVFNRIPILYACANQPFSYNHSVTDVDGDSLAFSLIFPRQGATSNITYNFPYTEQQPLTSTPPVAINGNTGTITFTPTVAGEVTVMTVLVQEYRNGQLIGTVLRDLQINVDSCSNTNPTVSCASGVIDCVTDSICLGDPFSLQIISNDIDGDNVTMTYGGEIPGATFPIINQGGMFPSGTFTWTPTAIGTYFFTVQVQDDACPFNGVAIGTYSLTVVYCECEEEYNLASCCENHLDDDNQTGGTTPNPLYEDNRKKVDEYLYGSSSSARGGVGDTTSCDPCVDGQYPLWIEDENGSVIGDPFNPYSDCYIIEWTDGNVTVQDWAIIAYPGVTYYVTVYDTCAHCVWRDSFLYRCCEELTLASCCENQVNGDNQTGGGGISPQKAANRATIEQYLNNSSGYRSTSGGIGDTTACDPCVDGQYPLWIEDESGDIVGDPFDPNDSCYVIVWTDGNTTYSGHAIVAFPGITYTVTVTDTCTGCVWVDSFLYECCTPTLPTNTRCYGFGNDVFVTWDPVPNAASYNVVINVNDPNCCHSTWGVSNIYNVTDTEFEVSALHINCFSWQVQSVCPDGTRSGFTAPICMPAHCPIIGVTGGGGSDGKREAREHIHEDASFMIYPVPASDRLHVRGKTLHEGTTIEMVNVLGQRVLTHPVTQEMETSIVLHKVPDGIYIVNIRDAKGDIIDSQKILIRK